MDTIRCPECGKEVADGAVVCSDCGAPIEANTPEQTENPETENGFVKLNEKGRRWYGLTMPLLSFSIIMLFVLLTISIDTKYLIYPFTAVLPLFLCALLLLGTLLLHICAVKNVAGENVKNIVIFSITLISLAIFLLPISRIVNSTILR